MAIIKEMQKKTLDRNTLVDATAFQSICRQAFEGVDEVESGRSPRSLFDSIFDIDRNGKINMRDERNRIMRWWNELLKRKSALIVVDVQNDFIEGKSFFDFWFLVFAPLLTQKLGRVE